MEQIPFQFEQAECEQRLRWKVILCILENENYVFVVIKE
jgi:hypothetical protein